MNRKNILGRENSRRQGYMGNLFLRVYSGKMSGKIDKVGLEGSGVHRNNDQCCS